MAEERVIVAGITGDIEDALVRAYFDEVRSLVESAGGVVVGEVIQRRSEPDGATYLGAGKVAELAERCRAEQAELVVLADEATPAQLMRLADALDLPVVDRTQVILDIFAQRARTREGKLQVELAQLTYLLPRLRAQDRSLSRLGGGIGTRGPGETKLETGRRHLQSRIAALNRQLERVRAQREVQRRARRELPHVALVGYTNAGKTSLLERLTQREEGAEDKLFATLDPAVRRLRLPGRTDVLLVDTVGFVQRLPHLLVAAFRATLEEVVLADLLVHVVDASSPLLETQILTVQEVLAELGAFAKPSLLVFNKCDRLTPSQRALLPRGPSVVYTSCCTGEGLAELVRRIEEKIAPPRVRARWLIPYACSRLLAQVHAEGLVVAEEWRPEGAYVEAEVEASLAARIAREVASAGS